MGWFTIQQSVATWLPFYAYDSDSGDPRTGITFDEVVVSYKKSTDLTFSAKALLVTDFRENGVGVYELKFSVAELDTLGSFLYVVNSNGALSPPAIKQYVGQGFIQTTAVYTPGTITLDTNVLTGNLLTLSGAALENAAVSARVLEIPAILGVSPTQGGVSTELITARTDVGGFFALELIQGAIVDISIPLINYRRTLTVPTNPTDILFDLP